jgi:hypothetical protein
MSAYSDTITVAYNGETVTIEPIEECKYDVNEVQFLNRYGALEILHFYKAQKERISVQGDTFKNNYTNGTSYTTYVHQNKRINVSGNTKTTIETGPLSENYNATIKELMLSEFVWLNGKPVNIASDSLEYKTRLVDRLISYSIDFEYAYDEISNV